MLDNLQIIYKPVKTIIIKVKPTLEVILIVPIDIMQDEIDHVLNKRYAWILKQLDYFRKFKPPKKELVSGESIVYLGRSYRLKISVANNESAKLTGGYLHIRLTDKNDYNKKLLIIEAWYRKKAEDYFKKIITKYTKVVKQEVAKISIRRMKTRWGSCNPKKSYINLNLDLIKKPTFAIEYVIFHELVHLIHYNHDQKFYNYLATHMPDWKIRKSKLELN